MYNNSVVCTRNFKKGWKCIISHDSLDEPCGLIPKWWNWSKYAREYRKAFGCR